MKGVNDGEQKMRKNEATTFIRLNKDWSERKCILRDAFKKSSK